MLFYCCKPLQVAFWNLGSIKRILLHSTLFFGTRILVLVVSVGLAALFPSCRSFSGYYHILSHLLPVAFCHSALVLFFPLRLNSNLGCKRETAGLLLVLFDVQIAQIWVATDRPVWIFVFCFFSFLTVPGKAFILSQDSANPWRAAHICPAIIRSKRRFTSRDTIITNSLAASVSGKHDDRFDTESRYSLHTRRVCHSCWWVVCLRPDVAAVHKTPLEAPPTDRAHQQKLQFEKC